jgi:hypothetical protein
MVDEGAQAGKKEFRKRDWVIAAIILLAITALGSFLYSHFGTSHNPIPKDIRADVAYTLYYPGQLPDGWEVEPGSFKIDDGVVFYRLKDSTHKNVSAIVTIQPTPTNFDYERYYKDNLRSVAKFMTPLGEAAIGKTIDNWLVGSQPTPDSWMLITSNSPKVTPGNIRAMLSGMKE